MVEAASTMCAQPIRHPRAPRHQATALPQSNRSPRHRLDNELRPPPIGFSSKMPSLMMMTDRKKEKERIFFRTSNRPPMPWTDRTLVIDNYDSFTWNLVAAIRALGDDPVVVRNDALSWEAFEERQPRRLIISPGPGTPDDAGISVELIRHLMKRRPILGVCLGHQCLARLAGADVRRAHDPRHGKTSSIRHTRRGLFFGIPSPLRVMRYHSLVADDLETSGEYEVTAWCNDAHESVIMAVEHHDLPVAGVQFHPESFLTEHGSALLENFLRW